MLASAAGAGLDNIEVSGQSMVTMSELASRVAAQGGAVLAIDYGQPGPYASSLQASPYWADNQPGSGAPMIHHSALSLVAPCGCNACHMHGSSQRHPECHYPALSLVAPCGCSAALCGVGMIAAKVSRVSQALARCCLTFILSATGCPPCELYTALTTQLRCRQSGGTSRCTHCRAQARAM